MIEKVEPLRADARENRARILEAAEEVFTEQGGGASLEAVAKRAGVGIGTLYRRFPTRDELLAATYSERLLAFAESSRADTAALERDPGSALRAFVEGLVVHINIYRGLAASIGMVLQSGTPGCAAISETGATLLRQAQDRGTIRSDIAFNDLVHIITAISLAIEHEGGSTARIGQLASIFFDGVKARPRV